MKQTLFFLLLSIATLQGQDIFINEIMSDNKTIIMDEDGDYSDWIELFNNTDTALDLSNYSLSDDIDDLDKWDFPTVEISPYSYLLIFASGKDKQGDELHSNFKILSDGEDVFLTKNGIIIDQFLSVSLGEDASFGRLPDGAIETYELNNPSPGSSNNLNDQLSFSHPQGFHSSPFYQKLVSLSGHEIHFTTDGSTPTLTSPIFPDSFFIDDRTSMPNRLTEIVTTPPDLENEAAEWKSPNDLIDKAYTIRYASFYNGIRTSRISSKTYFVGEEMSDKYEMPVISLITAADGFFDEEIGIYVPGISYESPHINTTGNYYLKGREWERDIHITYFDENGAVGFSQDAGVRISGGVTRKLAQKSLRLYARDEYGAKHFNYPLLPQKSFDEYENFTLRTTMGAWYHHTIIKDDLANEIVRDMDLGSQDYRPVIVFLNGEYWGIHTIKDRLDEKFIEYTYGIDREAVEMNNIWGNSNYQNLLNFIRENDLSQSVNYEYIESQLDIDHYINYQITEMYFNNYDWPANNIKGWRSDDFNGKWRWLFFDLDAGFGNPAYNMFQHCTNEDTSIIWPNPSGSTLLFRGLLKNDGFRQKFIQRFTTLLHQNFQASNILPKLLDIKKIYEPEIPRHIQRWGFPESVETWENDLVTDLVNFIQERPCHIETQIKDFFNLDTLGFSCNKEESSLPSLAIFPNPSNGLFFIENQSDHLFQGTMTIYNTLGQQVLSRKELAMYQYTKEDFTLLDLPNNMYFINISNDFFSKTYKLIISN